MSLPVNASIKPAVIGSNPFSGFLQRTQKLGTTISQGVSSAVNGVNNFRNSLQAGTNPDTKQAQLAQQAQPVNKGLLGSPAIDVMAPPPGTPGVKTPAQVKADSNLITPPNPQADVNAAHDALIKATQDKLKTAQTSLKTIQDGMAAGTMDSNGNPITKPAVAGDGSTPGAQNSGEIYHLDADGNKVYANTALNNKTGTATTTDANGNATFPGMVNKLANQQPIQNYQDLQNQISGIAQQKTDLQNAFVGQGAAIDHTAGFLNRAQGEQALAQNQYNQGQEALSTQQSALSQQLNAANTQQGLQQTGLTSAGTLAQPQGNTAYFGNPLTGGTINPSGVGGSSNQYGLPTSTGNPMMDKTVSQALQMASQPNADPMSADITSAVKALNSPQAWQAYLDGVQAIKGGTYNPAMTSATSASAASSAGQLNTDITNLTEGVAQVDAAGGLVTKFMKDFPQINSTIFGMVNSQAQKYLKSIGATGALAEYNSLMGTVNKYATQIVAGGYAGTPTGAQALQELAQANDLSLGDVQKYLNTVKSDGNTQIGVKKGVLNQLGGNTSLPTTTPQPIIPSAPAAKNGSLGANPYLQAGIATAAQNIDQIWNSVKNLAGEALGWVLKK